MVAGIFVGFGCNWREKSVQRQLVVKVESNELNSKQFADELALKLSKYDALNAKDPKNVNRVKESIINDFLMSSILKLWAQKNNLKVSKDVLEEEIRLVRNGFPDDLTFREELSKQGISVSQWQQQVEERLLERLALQRIQSQVPEPTSEEISKFYESNKIRFMEAEKVYLQQIVLTEQGDADQIQAALKQKKSFESLAKQFSIAPEAKDGGLVGWIERGTLEVFDKAFELPIGQPSLTIQSPYGFHILLVLKKTNAGPIPLPQVTEVIKRELKAKKEQTYFSSWLDQQVRSLHVYKDQQLINKMAVETRKE